ncbi:acyltransferase family protein [Flavobacterium sp. FlaQc-57]|uniref:acyltransferase family protein n=1 Tax=Flavobacterium sp. FlaQc-57 TaxID=3374186 RepID=UPI0037575756
MRYKELDGLRGIAALSVVFSHLVGAFVFNSPLFNFLSNSPFHVFWHGDGAVTLFFLLSGFVLALPYITKKKDFNIGTFYIKRVFRIYPAFILAILFSYFLKHSLFKPLNIIDYSPWINEFWNWDFKEVPFAEYINTFILVGFSFNFKLFIPVIWTLRLEMIISLILPFFIIIALRNKLVYNLIILLILFYIRDGVIAVFYLGILMAIYLEYILNFLNRITNKFYILILFTTGLFLYTSRFSLDFILDNQNKAHLFLTTLGCSIFLVLSMKNGVCKKILNLRPIQFLGEISYSLYLLHFPVILIACSFFSGNIITVFCTSLFVTILLSYLSYKFIELPFISLGRKIVMKRFDEKFNKIIFLLNSK